MTNRVAITGIGLVSALGEGAADHSILLKGAAPPTAQSFSASMIHPLAEIDFDRQIPKKGDQRQMESWQRIGVYAAGLALEHAGVKDNADLLAKTHMIVAAGGGERDEAVDSAVLNAIRDTPNKDVTINERLMNDLRPTLFLAQLSNLLAGNISIVHNVTGSSRTFMGEEAAGMDAIRTLHARIAAGQAEIGLVGGSFNAARRDMMLNYAFAGLMLAPPFAPVWLRTDTHGGMAMGSMGAFLVLESEAHAKARGAKIFALLSHVQATRCNRAPGELTKSLTALYEGLPQDFKQTDAVISCASGVSSLTAEEYAFWNGVHPGVALRALGTAVGHGFEAQAPFACALAALALSENSFPAPQEEKEKPLSAAPKSILVSCCGHWRGEGLMALEKSHA